MNPPTLHAETEALIQGYLEGTLTPDEAARLLSAVKVEPALVGTILDGLRTDALIRRVVAEASVVPLPDQSRATVPVAASSAISSVAPTRNSAPTLAFPQIAATEKSRRWQFPLALAASLVLLLGLAAWYFGTTMGQPLIADVQGSDVSLERGTQFIPAARGIHIQPADVLRTGTNATAIIMFGPEKTRLSVCPGSEFKLVSLARGKRFDLPQGKIEATVARQRLFMPMLVGSPQAEVRVLGTQFSLTVVTNSTRLAVEEGKVRLTRAGDGTRVDVPANHYAVAAANSELAALPLTGWILREYWTNLPSTRFELNLMFHPAFSIRPDGFEWLSRLEITNAWGKNYVARWRGYLHPPLSGEYRLGLAAADEAVLYLSPNDRPEEEVSVGRPIAASLDNWNPDREGTLARFNFIAGRRYYIEVLYKAGQGEDRLAVTWKRPDGKIEIIPGDYLSPFKPRPKDVK